MILGGAEMLRLETYSDVLRLNAAILGVDFRCGICYYMYTR